MTPRTYRVRGNTANGFSIAIPIRSATRYRIRALGFDECDLLIVPTGTLVYIPVK